MSVTKNGHLRHEPPTYTDNGPSRGIMHGVGYPSGVPLAMAIVPQFLGGLSVEADRCPVCRKSMQRASIGKHVKAYHQ